jgi:hypothetical protein
MSASTVYTMAAGHWSVQAQERCPFDEWAYVDARVRPRSTTHSATVTYAGCGEMRFAPAHQVPRSSTLKEERKGRGWSGKSLRVGGLFSATFKDSRPAPRTAVEESETKSFICGSYMYRPAMVVSLQNVPRLAVAARYTVRTSLLMSRIDHCGLHSTDPLASRQPADRALIRP